MALGEISPLRSIQSILKHWWVLVLLGVLGGGIGWLVHYLRPPLYEAKAVMAFNIDFPSLTDENLSIYIADQTFGAGGALMFSTSVLEQLVSEAQSRGIDVNLTTIVKMVQYPERRQNLWTLRVRHPDPQTAADLANLWAEISYQQLEEAHSHAVRASVLQTYLQALGECPDPPDLNPPPPAICAGQGGIDRQDLPAIEAELNAEIQASRGILTDLLFTFSQRAQVPDGPVSFETGSLVISGALIGFLCGVLLLSFPVDLVPTRSSKDQAGRGPIAS
jgi:capsular polysaccharide biosynthesis protein